MARIIAIANQKGGVGKTTTSNALVSGLKERGYKTLLVDTDPQSNATDTLHTGGQEDNTIYTVFTGESDPVDAVITTEQGDILPGDLRMSAADMQFVQQGREYILKKALTPLREKYDYIIIDSPPALGIITVNALTAADSILVPIIADRYSLQGLTQLSGTIATVREYSNPQLEIAGILLTRFNERTILARDIQDIIKEVADSWDTKVFKSTIRQSVALPESQTQQESIFTYAPESTTAEDYNSFIDEFLEGENNG